MTLRLYNTLTGTKEEFRPIDPAHVRVYVCGPTVYDLAHIGNARPLIVFDVLYRVLRRVFGPGSVSYARNLTDVDDKINARAAERGVTIRDLTDETTRAFHADVAALGCLPPDVEPRATDHIAEMREMIETLVRRGIAYVASDHVLFSVSAMNARGVAPKYGALSRRTLDEMIAGARVEVAPYKREPTDFVLWKPSKAGEPSWASPCAIAAPGRPGWHIECSAMSYAHLVRAFAGRIRCAPADAQTFDIHGGGIDLVFPHHENEIAQSCCALDTKAMARVWMHNGFLQVEGEKMSKSVGNFVTIRDLLKDWPGQALRLNMLKTHYRQPIDWTLASLRESEREIERWYGVVDGVDQTANSVSADFQDALDDDLNTPEAITVLRRLYRTASGGEGGAGASLAASSLAACGRLIGLFGVSSADYAASNPTRAHVDVERVQKLISARAEARAGKQWAESDRLRDELAAMGVTLQDNKDGTTSWEAKR